MIIVGLTGSIGMGKSTAAAMLRRMGVPVYDADAAVHALQARNGPALPAIEGEFPGVVKDGVLDRAALGLRVFGNKPALRRLEAIVHPMVRTHALHGSKAVYFHITKTKYIEGMTPEDSKAYMNDLLERMIRPDIVYHHQWRKGDVLVIDDRATMHRAHGDYDRSQARVLWRIIAEGDRPVLI